MKNASPLLRSLVVPAAALALASCRSGSVEPDNQGLSGMYRLEEVNAKRLPTEVTTTFTVGTVTGGDMACDRNIHCQLRVTIDSAGRRRDYRLSGYFAPLTGGRYVFNDSGGRPVFEATWDGGTMVRTQNYLEMAMAFRWTGEFRFPT